jgi:predicted ribosomally synthesized peptide with nif11-like leader
MSKDAVAEFLVRIDADSNLRETLRAVLAERTEQAPTMVEVAANNGFEFTVDEYNQVIDDIASVQTVELSEEELEAAAGGTQAAPPVFFPDGSGKKQSLQHVRFRRGNFLFDR